jgi:FlaG/FlaF family flagellin (archaellin)
LTERFEGKSKHCADLDLFTAIVDFKVAYQVYNSSGLQDSRHLQSVSNIQHQADTLSISWQDGNKLTTTVRAIDVLDKTKEEAVTVYRDATPPVIEDLWLTRGDRLNVSVHRIEDFAQMT